MERWDFLHPTYVLPHHNEQEAKSHLSFGMCAFSPPHFPMNVHFFAATRSKQSHTFPSDSIGMCVFSPPIFLMNVHLFAATRSKQNHIFPTECAFFRIRGIHFLIATSKKQNHIFSSECALFRRHLPISSTAKKAQKPQFFASGRALTQNCPTPPVQRLS